MHSALGMPGLLAGSIVGLSPVDRPHSGQSKMGGLSPASAEIRRHSEAHSDEIV